MANDKALSREQWERFCYCRDNGHIDFVQKADTCERFFAGKHWINEDLALLREQRRPAITINKTIATIGTILGEQIQNRVEVLFRPKAGAPAEVADALSKVWLGISQDNQLPWVRSDVFCDGIIRSRGFYDVRLDFSDSLVGDVRISLLNGKNVLIDPDAEEYDPDQWADCFVTKWMTWQEIEILYGKKYADELKARAGSMFAYGLDSIEFYRDRFMGVGTTGLAPYDPGEEEGVTRSVRVIERQYRKLAKQEHFVDVEAGDTRPVPENWDRDRIALLLEKAGGRLAVTEQRVRRIRWTVTADDLVLHDDWSPYRHFTVVPYFPYFRYGTTIGLVENLIGPQEILNKASSQELHVINTTANSGWVIEDGSLSNMTIPELEARGAQTGLVLVYNKSAQPPQKIQPNQVPTGLDRVTYKAEEHIKTISNVSDSMMGFDREDVAAKAIAYKQQRGSVNLTKVLDNLERTDYLLARNVLDIVQAYYTEPRLLTITHDDFAHEAEQIEVNAPNPATGEIVNDLTLGEYDIVITSSPYRASLEDSQFEQALSLRKEGVAVPDRVLIENSRLLGRADIIKEMEASQNSPEAQAQAELQMRGMQAEVALKEAEVARTQADAAKKGADAQAKASEAGEDTQAKEALELRKMMLEFEFKQRELEMKQREMEMKLQAKQVEQANDLAYKQAERQQEIEAKAREAELQESIRRAQALRGEGEGESELNPQKRS
ncbi:MAG: genomic island protein [Planctomycetota bacterium]|jgi:hypothetical protein|nr:genomic island protein [Planctomycetota bacterium]